MSRIQSSEEYFSTENEPPDEPFSLKLSRTSSNTSLAARAITQEEGRMHRFGQSIRREVLKPTGTDDFEHGTSKDDEPEPEHLAALRARLESYKGEEIRRNVEEQGADKVLKDLGTNAQELRMLQKEDPVGFEAFKNSQLAAQINSGMLDSNGTVNPEQKT
jgi:hypothetical protein